MRKNQVELSRLKELYENIKTLNRITGNRNAWRNLSLPNRHRLHLLELERKRHPEQYTNLPKKIQDMSAKLTARAFFYGYGAIAGRNWVKKTGALVPKYLPKNEIKAFFRYTPAGTLKPGTVLGRTGNPARLMTGGTTLVPWRNNFVKEGSLRPLVLTARPKPVPAKTPSRGFEPTLKRLAWNALPVKNMTSEQLNFLSKLTGTNWKLLRPKPIPKPLSPKTLERYRRNLAARTIQRAFRSKR